MTQPIRDYVGVRPHPTVVRLQDLDAPSSAWLSETFLVTPEVQSHLQILRRTLQRGRGAGIFLIGHYGSGKSHLLAYCAQQLRSGGLLPSPPAVRVVSLVNFSAANRLEDIVANACAIDTRSGDRRPAWDEMLSKCSHGLVLIIDELSEFLRAKSDAHAFNEDVRFLQFLGEWAQDRPLWIIAAMQEAIEHTGEIEYGLYRKIKDRYPLRLLLTPAHVRALIADSILQKTPGYATAVAALCRELKETYPESALDYDALQAVYPLHPQTLGFLEEVRDRFSQARGIVDFTVTRLAGDVARAIAPFLDEPFGALLTPDVIVDHFRDLLEVQPEFLPLSQRLFPWYETHLVDLFESPALRELARKILKLLVLVHLAPRRERLSAAEAAVWLLLHTARVEPQRNRQILERVLSTLATRGRYVVERNGGFCLDLADEGGAGFEQILAREMASLQGQDALVFETLLPLLVQASFNPFELPRDTWQHRRVLWHFHERRFAVWLGGGMPPPIAELGLCLRLPWEEAAPAAGLYTLQPAPMSASVDLVELAALLRLQDQPGNAEMSKRIQQRLSARTDLFAPALRSAWQETRLITPDGTQEPAPRLEARSTIGSWLESIALLVLRRTYPAFERFAPAHGPLPKETWLRFMRFAASEDIGAAEADDHVRLVREGYLVPMGLLRRKGAAYSTPANLDRHELVSLLRPLLEHGPSPRALHEHLAQPIYGLVEDQINLVLLFLLLQGEIDIVKGRTSYRDTFETLPNPLHYDRVIPGHGLRADQLDVLDRLCEGLQLRRPSQWSVLTQRRCAVQLGELRRARVEPLERLARQLEESEEGRVLAARLRRHIGQWNALDKGEHALQGLEHFLFEIGSPTVFLQEASTCEQMIQRVPRLLAETRRYTHLLGHPTVVAFVQHSGTPEPGGAPGLDDFHALERWIDQVEQLYSSYKQAYSERHASWWQAVAAHPIWEWQPPLLARSRHVHLDDNLLELEACRRDAVARRCRALVDLDYQPQCACGFGDDGAAIKPLLERFTALRAVIESQLRLFFQQDSVKARLRAWQRDGIEMNAGTLSYLEGRAEIPEVRDLASFDQYMSGVELTVEMEVRGVVELLQQRVWERGELLAALDRQFAGAQGRRLRFTGNAATVVPPPVLEWCAEHCVRHGVALPAGLQRRELAAVTQALRAEWIGSTALQRLGSLGLDDDGVDCILGWLLDGHVAVPDSTGAIDAAVAAAADLLHPCAQTTPQRLAAHSERLYHVHQRLWRLAGERWLRHLDSVAKTPLQSLPPLTELLKTQLRAQWLLIDCLGLPLLGTAQSLLAAVFAEWHQHPPQFAIVSRSTTTDGCYADLVAAGINHSFVKVDVVDALVHAEHEAFATLAGAVTSKLSAALRQLLPKLDPERTLVIFADHGFCLAANGRGYTHGGGSTLERVVPVWRLDPR